MKNKKRNSFELFIGKIGLDLAFWIASGPQINLPKILRTLFELLLALSSGFFALWLVVHEGSFVDLLIENDFNWFHLLILVLECIFVGALFRFFRTILNNPRHFWMRFNWGFLMTLFITVFTGAIIGALYAQEEIFLAGLALAFTLSLLGFFVGPFIGLLSYAFTKKEANIYEYRKDNCWYWGAIDLLSAVFFAIVFVKTAMQTPFPEILNWTSVKAAGFYIGFLFFFLYAIRMFVKFKKGSGNWLKLRHKITVILFAVIFTASLVLFRFSEPEWKSVFILMLILIPSTVILYNLKSWIEKIKDIITKMNSTMKNIIAFIVFFALAGLCTWQLVELQEMIKPAGQFMLSTSAIIHLLCFGALLCFGIGLTLFRQSIEGKNKPMYSREKNRWIIFSVFVILTGVCLIISLKPEVEWNNLFPTLALWSFVAALISICLPHDGYYYYPPFDLTRRGKYTLITCGIVMVGIVLLTLINQLDMEYLKYHLLAILLITAALLVVITYFSFFRKNELISILLFIPLILLFLLGWVMIEHMNSVYLDPMDLIQTTITFPFILLGVWLWRWNELDEIKSNMKLYG